MNMQESIYKVQWVLNFDDDGKTGYYGTTSHRGASPAAAALASAQCLSHTIDQKYDHPQLYILRVTDENHEGNLLSGSDLQAALRRSFESLPFEVVYRPIC
jgi:hypothetical protein